MYKFTINFILTNLFPQVGGFVTPFLVLGSTLFLSAVMTAFVLPDHPNRRNDITSDGNF